MMWLMLLILFMVAAPNSVRAEPPASANAQTAPKAPEQPGNSVAGRFGDWALVCGVSKDKAHPAPCVLVQQLVDATSKKTVFHITVGYGPRGNLVLIVRSPLGVDLAKGFELSLGGQTIQRGVFSTCKPDGCQAALILSGELQQEMRKAGQALLAVYGLDGKPFQVAASLKGFGDALSALDKRRGPS